MAQDVIRAILGDEAIAGLPASYVSALECELTAEILKDPDIFHHLSGVVVKALHQEKRSPGGTGRPAPPQV